MVSLCASASRSPSATITAPTGTSSRTDAARARRRAACIPARSLGDGVPLRTRQLRNGRRVNQREVVTVAYDPDRVSLVEPALQQLQRDAVLQLALNDALERSRAVDRIVALLREQLAGFGGDLELEVPLRQQLLQPDELEIHDPHEVGPGKWTENDDVVHPV